MGNIFSIKSSIAIKGLVKGKNTFFFIDLIDKLLLLLDVPL